MVPEPVEHDLLQVVGGLAIGKWAGHLPDRLEPAHSPDHRAGLHSSEMLGLTGAGTAFGAINSWVDGCRGLAMDARSKRNASWSACGQSTGWDRAPHAVDAVLYLAAEVVACLAAAAPGAFCAGYASHLLADAETPKGLPSLLRELVAAT
jgi:hypothetical protein